MDSNAQLILMGVLICYGSIITAYIVISYHKLIVKLWFKFWHNCQACGKGHVGHSHIEIINNVHKDVYECGNCGKKYVII